MSALPNQPARLNLRLTAQHKALIERAAASMGVTLSDFVIAELVRSAQRTLAEESVSQLNAAESLALVRLLARPPAPNSALRSASQRYRARTGERGRNTTEATVGASGTKATRRSRGARNG